MPWAKRTSAPDYANLAEKVLAIVTGGPDAWLVPWFNLAPGNIIMDVNAFCELGPPEPVEFDGFDFLGIIGQGRVGNGVNSANLGTKVGQWMLVKLFEAYCWDTTSDVLCEMWWPGTIATESGSDPPWRDLTGPWRAGTTYLQFHRVGGPGSGTASFHIFWYVGSSFMFEEPYPVFMSNAGVTNVTVPVGADRMYIRAELDVGSVWDISYCGAGFGGYPFEPDPIVQPDSAIPPTPGVYTTIADLGAELDAIENKLHWVLEYTSGQVVEKIAPQVADESFPDLAEDEDVPLSDDVTGFIVSVTGIPDGVDMRFGDPPTLIKLGRVLVGNGTAWEPFELTVSPMLFLKTNTLQTACRVQVLPPAVASVITLVKAPPVG